MAVKRDMPEESKNSKVVKKEHFSIVFPDDIKEPKNASEQKSKMLKRKQMIINKKEHPQGCSFLFNREDNHFFILINSDIYVHA